MKIFKLLATVAIVALWSVPALADIQVGSPNAPCCWSAFQDNGWEVQLNITQTGSALTVNLAQAIASGRVRDAGSGYGSVTGGHVEFTITWRDGQKGQYTGDIQSDRHLKGNTTELNCNQTNKTVCTSGWHSNVSFSGSLVPSVPPVPPPPQFPSPLGGGPGCYLGIVV